jgi:hypothetical protein
VPYNSSKCTLILLSFLVMGRLILSVMYENMTELEDVKGSLIFLKLKFRYYGLLLRDESTV